MSGWLSEAASPGTAPGEGRRCKGATPLVQIPAELGETAAPCRDTEQPRSQAHSRRSVTAGYMRRAAPWLSPEAPAEPARPLRQYLLPLPAGPALPAAADHPVAAVPALSRVPPRLPSAADCFRVQEPPIRIPAPPLGANLARRPRPCPAPNAGRRAWPRLRPLPGWREGGASFTHRVCIPARANSALRSVS